MFLLLSALGVSGVQSQVDTSVYSNAAYPTVSATCDDAFTASTTFLLPNFALGAQNSAAYDVPVLLRFEPHTTTAETTATAVGAADVQVLSNQEFQVLMPANTVSSTFTDTYRANNDLAAFEQQPTGVKVSSLALDLLSGDVALTSDTSKAGQTTDVVTIVAELVEGAVAPDLDSVLDHYNNNCPKSAFPFQECPNFQTDLSASSCLSNIDVGALATAGSGATATVVSASTNRVSYSFDSASAVDAETLVFYMALLANEPQVRFVEPTVAQQVLASRTANNINGGAALAVVQGNPNTVAEGAGVSGQCAYLHDRDVDGTGETIAIIDNGLQVDSTFFYDPNDGDIPCSGSDCCSAAAAGGCADLDAACDQECYDTSDSLLGVNAVDSDPTARSIVSFVPLADRIPATHGTMVTSTILGSPLVDRELECPEEFAGTSDLRGVASGAHAVFIDAGNDGDDTYLDLPIPSFGNVLQELAYDNNDANEVVLAFGGESNGAADTITRDIDNFVAANSDAIVVTAAGGRDSTNGNGDTALSKNALSVGVFSSADMPTVSPDLSVQFSTSFLAGTALESSGAADTTNYCGTAEFTGSSAAASVVAGQVALIEHFIKREEVNIFQYDAARSQSLVAGEGYTGATLKAVLVAAANNNGMGAEYGNGYGVPTLENVLPFGEEHQTDLRVEVHTFSGTGDSVTREITITDTAKPLVVSLAYDDVAPSAFAAAAANQIVNDVRLTVTTPPTDFFPNGQILFPNGNTDGSSAPATLQKITIDVPVEGTYTVTISSPFVSEQSITAQDASLVVSARFSVESVNDGVNVVTGQDAGEVTDTPACCPYGTVYPTTSCFSISFLVLIVLAILVVGLCLICIVRAKLHAKETTDEEE